MIDYETDEKGQERLDPEQEIEFELTAADDSPHAVSKSSFFRIVKMATLIFVVALSGIFAFAYFSGERESLPLEYEGFD